MKLFTVVGARPQFIKAAALSKAISDTKKSSNPINEQIIHTGQHFDEKMSNQFFKELEIPEPSINLGIGGGSHGSNTGRMIIAIEKILISDRPDALLVYGDTDSTLAGALAASKLKIPILHIEAGLRSFNRNQPEEQNRVLTDHLSEICFSPTNIAFDNLKKEGIAPHRIVKTGDVMADSARIFSAKAEAGISKYLMDIVLPDEEFILATIHRAENTDNLKRLERILKALNEAPLKVILPLHPRTLNRINEGKLGHLLKPFKVTSPLGFLTMLLLEKLAKLVVTDSGGVQKEAFLQGTPCVTVRSETEWIELLECGWNLLAEPDDINCMVNSIKKQLNVDLNKIRPNFYGDGFACQEIILSIQSL